MHILIAEDDAISRLILEIAVKKFGHACTTARDGCEAWRLFQESPFDAIISDWMMPGMDGVELCRHVRASARNSYPYFILLTALSDRDHLFVGLQAGADDYLAKPLDRDELQVRLIAAERVTSLYRRLNRQHQQLEAELARAGQVQADLLPRDVPVIPGFSLAACCLPAREVGGDFYDWHEAGGILTLTLGDVSGKGMPAALFMATVRTAFRVITDQAAPAAAVTLAAHSLETDLDRSGGFVTLFHAQLDPGNGQLTYADAGHGHVFVRRADGTPDVLEPRGLPIGVLPGETYAEGMVALHAGDALILYSDGLIDARPDVMLDPAAIARHLDGAQCAAAMVDRLRSLATTAAALPDDLTVVVLYRCSA